jgi:hypothetical protein
MSGNNRYVLGAAAALVIVGALYMSSGNSTAYTDRGLSESPRIDVLAIMSGSEHLPSQHFDAI